MRRAKIVILVLLVLWLAGFIIVTQNIDVLTMIGFPEDKSVSSKTSLPELSESMKISKPIKAKEGGTISVKNQNGVEISLSIPPDSLQSDASGHQSGRCNKAAWCPGASGAGTPEGSAHPARESLVELRELYAGPKLPVQPSLSENREGLPKLDSFRRKIHCTRKFRLDVDPRAL